MTRTIRLLALAAVAIAAASPAAAHHSFAMFDQAKQVTLKGVVREFQWTNPHSWLQLTIKNAAGASEDWSIEMLSPNVLGRMGWKRNSVKPGDEVSVTLNPLRTGAHGGNMIALTDKDGRQIGGLAAGAVRTP